MIVAMSRTFNPSSGPAMSRPGACDLLGLARRRRELRVSNDGADAVGERCDARADLRFQLARLQTERGNAAIDRERLLRFACVKQRCGDRMDGGHVLAPAGAETAVFA